MSHAWCFSAIQSRRNLSLASLLFNSFAGRRPVQDSLLAEALFLVFVDGTCCPFGIQKEDLSDASDELTPGIGRMEISDDSPILSPKTASTVSFSGEGNGPSRVGARPRDALNIFLNQCQIQSLGRPWLDWGVVSVRTRQRYVQRCGEIVADVLKVISPNNAPHLWKALQTSGAVNQQLGLHQVSLPSETAYLEALA